MWKQLISAGLVLTGLCLAGCDKIKPGPPAPQIDAGQPTLPKPATAPGDTSVPSAGSVLTPAPATATANDKAGARPSGDLTRAEESSAMPMPGQANNHSSPASSPATRSSAP